MKKRIIVVGSGGAGLTAAVAAAKRGAEVLLLSKTACGDANCTAYSGGSFPSPPER
ncbi:MAG: FAD-binding protein [Aminivibrio sp.]|nr:FAD-binding protein [Aminivibrio sp.]